MNPETDPDKLWAREAWAELYRHTDEPTAQQWIAALLEARAKEAESWAILAYDDFAVEVETWGEFARVNFPDRAAELRRKAQDVREGK